MFISITKRDGVISMKYLTHRVAAESTGDFSAKIVFSLLLAAILNFCVKHKNLLISESEREKTRLSR